MKNHRKKAVAILAGLAVTGIVGASAASLGTITSPSLGAATEVVASCDTNGVSVSYGTSYNGTTDTVNVDSVTVSAIAQECAGLDWELMLIEDGTPRVAFASATGTLSTPLIAETSFTASSFTDSFGAAVVVDAERLDGLAITISG